MIQVGHQEEFIHVGRGCPERRRTEFPRLKALRESPDAALSAPVWLTGQCWVTGCTPRSRRSFQAEAVRARAGGPRGSLTAPGAPHGPLTAPGAPSRPPGPLMAPGPPHGPRVPSRLRGPRAPPGGAAPAPLPPSEPQIKCFHSVEMKCFAR